MHANNKFTPEGSNKKALTKLAIFFIPAIVAIPIAIFAPLDILQYSNLNAFVNLIQIFVPMISKIHLSESTWQISKLYYAVAWACVPFSAGYFILRGIENKDQFLKVRRERNQTHGIRALLIMMMGLFFYGLWSYGLTDETHGIEYAATYTRAGMVTIGIFFILLAAVFLGMIVVHIMYFNEE
jgi:small-conductance mechanosensitive channel